MFRTDVNTTILKDALARKPTFILLSLGSTCIFRYAMSGGNENGGGEIDKITPSDEFRDSLYSIVKSFKDNGVTGGVISNIIDLNSFPYFRYRKWNSLILTASEATALTQYYAGKGDYTFNEGANAIVIEDPASSNGLGHRRILSNEYQLIQVDIDSVNCGRKWGSYHPMPQRWVLDRNEIDSVNNAVAEYNIIIKEIADEFDLILDDANTGMKSIVNGGIYIAGKEITSEFASGGYFSLDGLNITALGRAVAANGIIDAINKRYGATIPKLAINNFSGTTFK